MMRINGAIERYQQGLAFADTLIPENQPHIMQVRLGKIGQEDMEYMFKLFYDHAHYLVEETEYKGPECPGAEYHMNQLQARFVGRALYEKGVIE